MMQSRHFELKLSFSKLTFVRYFCSEQTLLKRIEIQKSLTVFFVASQEDILFSSKQNGNFWNIYDSLSVTARRIDIGFKEI